MHISDTTLSACAIIVAFVAHVFGSTSKYTCTYNYILHIYLFYEIEKPAIIM